MSAFVPEVQAQARAASRLLIRIVQEYFADPVHRAEFEVWYKKQTGEDYVWKKVTDPDD